MVSICEQARPWLLRISKSVMIGNLSSSTFSLLISCRVPSELETWTLVRSVFVPLGQGSGKRSMRSRGRRLEVWARSTGYRDWPSCWPRLVSKFQSRINREAWAKLELHHTLVWYIHKFGQGENENFNSSCEAGLCWTWDRVITLLRSLSRGSSFSTPCPFFVALEIAF